MYSRASGTLSLVETGSGSDFTYAGQSLTGNTALSIQVVDLAKRFEADGVSAIVYTDIAKDGMMQGCNVEATAALANATSIPVIASGGIHHIGDIQTLLDARAPGIIGAITGRAIYEGTLDLAEAIALTESN